MSTITQFLDTYALYLQHTVDHITEKAFKWSLANLVDMTTVNRIERRVQRAQSLFENICKAVDKQEADDIICCVCYEHEADKQ